MSKTMGRRTAWAAAALLLGGTVAAGAVTAVPARAAAEPPLFVVNVTVTGSQYYYYGDPQFSFSIDSPDGAGLVSGSVTCTAVVGAGAITPTLPLSNSGGNMTYQIDAASCSGLSVPSGDVLEYHGGPFTVYAPEVIAL